MQLNKNKVIQSAQDSYVLKVALHINSSTAEHD